MKTLLTILAITVLTSRTITDGSAIVIGTKRAAISIDQVRIYRVAPEDYEEIAMLSSSAGHDFKSDSTLIESAIQKLKEEAAKIGANGVLLEQIVERDASSTTTSYGNTQSQSNDGSSTHTSGNSISVNRGDTYTRMKGLAIFVRGL